MPGRVAVTTAAIVQQGEMVMSVRKLRIGLDRPLVTVDRLGGQIGPLEQRAKLKPRMRIVGIGGDRETVVMLGDTRLPLVLEQTAEAQVRRHVLRFEVDRPPVRLARVRGRVLLDLEAEVAPVVGGHAVPSAWNLGHRQPHQSRRPLPSPITRLKVEQELTAVGIPAARPVPRHDALSVDIYTETRERPVSYLAAERQQKPRDPRQRNILLEQTAHETKLNEIPEIEAQATAPVSIRPEQPGSHASSHAPWRDPDDPGDLSGPEYQRRRRGGATVRRH